ncbi:MAG TPA: type IV pilus secretin PilQ [Kofleriaceae bacterium]|nr:type IV pilus secretin PilQ [Kofleriaceae bacterium]
MSSRIWIAAAVAVVLGASSAVRADARNEVRAVTYDEDAGMTRVHVRGATTPTFTVYKLDKPSRVVIDLPGAQLAEALRGHDSAATFTAGTWAVSTIAAQQLDDGAVRVIVTLARPGRYDVKTEGNDVIVMVMPRDPAPKLANPAELDAAKAAATRAQAEADRLRAVAAEQTARAEAAQRAVEAAKQQQATNAASAADLARAKDAAAQAQADADKARGQAIDAQREAARSRDEMAKAQQRADQEIAKSRAEAAQVVTAANQARSDAERARVEAAQAKSDADKRSAAAAQAEAEAARTRAEAEQVRSAAAQAKSDADKRTAAAAQAQADAERERAAAQQAAQDAARTKLDLSRESAKTRAELDQARAEAAKTRAEADAARQDAEHVRQEADATRAELAKLGAAERKSHAEAEAAKAEAARAKSDAIAARADAEAARAEAAADKRQADADKQRAETERADAEKLMASARQQVAALDQKTAAAQQLEDRARAASAAAEAREEAARDAAAKAAKDRADAEAAVKAAQVARDRAAAADRAKLADDERSAEQRLADARTATEQAAAERSAAEQAAAQAKQQLATSRSALASVEQQRQLAEAAATDAARKRSEAEAAASDAVRRRGEAEVAASQATRQRGEAERAASDAARRRTVAEQERAAALLAKTQAEDAAKAAQAAEVAAEGQRKIAEAAADRAVKARDDAQAGLGELETRRAAAEKAASELEARTRAEAKAQAEIAAASARKAGDAELAKARAAAAALETDRKKAEAELADRRKAVEAQQAEAARLQTVAAQARDAADREELRKTRLAEQREQEEQQLAAIKQQKAAAAVTPVVAKAPPPPPAPAKKDVKLATVKDILFSGDASAGTVDLAMTGDADVALGEVTAEHVELIVDRAQLGPKLERTLDVSRFGSPIRLVSSFRDRRTPNRVRLVVELAQPATPTIDRDATGVHWHLAANDVARRAPRATNVPSPVFGGFGAVSTPVAQQSVAQVPPPATGRRRIYHGATVDLDFKDAPIHDLLRLLAATGHVNIVVPDTIDYKVTVSLKRVPWDQALEVILQSHGLWYRREGNLYRIAQRKDLDAEDEAEATRREAAIKAESPHPEVVRLNYASANELKGKFEGMLSPKGKIEVDERTNALIVNDVAGNREQIVRLALSLDTQTPQVTIEARIVEADSNFTRDIGIQWGGNALAGPAGGNATGLTFPSSVAITGANTDTNTPGAGVAVPSDFAVNLPAATGTGAGGAIGFSLGSIAGNLNINLRLSALESDGTVRIISAPKVTVLNGREAKIAQGTSVPISVVSAAGTNTQFVQADLSLTVTPYVSLRDCAIAMQLAVTNNAPDFNHTAANGIPTIQRKEAHTRMLVNDGETSVLGGIYTRNYGAQYAKVPLLGDLPFFGWLFKRRTDTDNRTELLVFITPRITNRASLKCSQ